MTQPRWHLLSLAALSLMACDGREVSVFELPAHVGGAAGSSTSGGAGSAGSDTASAGSSAGMHATPAGGGSGGSAGGGGRGPSSEGGSAGSYGGALPGNGGGVSCTSEFDCMGWVCEKQGCDAPTGVCVPYPPLCPDYYSPVCGCDGVTYWNDCLRLRSGARLAGPDICRAGACTCEVGADCNVPYASCSHLLPPGETMCGHGMGACWVLPPQCPLPPQGARMWRECKPPEAGGTGACLDMCSAIATEHSYAELHRGEVCQ